MLQIYQKKPLKQFYTVSRVKDIKLSTAIKLANALNCSLDDLVQRK